MSQLSKLKITVTSILSLFFGILAVAQPIKVEPVQSFEPDKFLFCEIFGTNESKNIFKAAKTEWVPYLIASKSATSGQDNARENIYNQMLTAAGYKVGIDKPSTPFEQFGLAGIKFTSYTGEWKYYDVNPCDNGDRQTPKSTNYGEFYEGRLDPLSTYEERYSTIDVRTKEYARGRTAAFWKAMKDNFNNLFVGLAKWIVGLTLVLVSIALSDFSALIGFTDQIQASYFLRFYSGIFLPFVSLMFLGTAGYLIYHGLYKKEYRTAVIGGIAKPLICYLVAVLLAVNPKMITYPNKLSVMLQAVVVSGLTESISGDGSGSLCPQTVENQNTDINSESFLSDTSTYMKQVIGCRIWSEYLFKPFIQGQFGTEYKNLEKLENENEKWVGKPEIKYGNTTIENWGLFHVSVMSGNHIPIDGEHTYYVGYMNKDYYRLVDTLSNYDEDFIAGSGGNSELAEGGSSSGGGYGCPADVVANVPNIDKNACGPWTKEGTREYNIAKAAFDYWTQHYGLSGEGAAGILGNIQAESSFSPSLVEAENGQSYSARGYGLYQFTPGTKFLNHPRYNPNDSDEGMVQAQTDVAVELEFANGQIKHYTNNCQRYFKFECTIEDSLLAATDPTTAAFTFCATFERPAMGPTLHPERRESAARIANYLFNKDGIQADPSKWPLNGGSGGSGGAAGDFGSFSGKIPIPKDNPPLKEWDYWIGNQGGTRFSAGLLMLVFSIVGSVGPIFFSLLASSYSIGITLLMLLAPVFLLFGCWGGKGNEIMMKYLGSIASTIIKRVGATFLLIFSIIIATNTFELVNSIGVLKALLFLVVTTYVLIRQKDKILSKLSELNIPKFSEEPIKNTMNKAKDIGSDLGMIGAGGIVGGIAAKKGGGSFTDGFKEAAKATTRQKMYKYEIGRKAQQVYASSNKGDKDNTIKGRHCVECGIQLNEGDMVYTDENQNYYCDTCASARGYEGMNSVFVDNENDEYYNVTRANTQVGIEDIDGNIKTVQYLDLDEILDKNGLNINEGTNIEQWSNSEDLLKERISDSMGILIQDLSEAKASGKPLSRIYIPEPLRSILREDSLAHLVRKNDYDGIMSETNKAWEKWFTIRASNAYVNSGVSVDDKAIDSIKESFKDVNNNVDNLKEKYFKKEEGE